MDIESLRKYCLSKKGVTEEFPFDEDTMVFKVMGKMFLLTDLVDYPLRINIKCDPETAVALRERYDSVIPGWHMNKIHWNTVIIDNTIPEKEILGWIDDSYTLIVNSLSRKLKQELEKIE